MYGHCNNAIRGWVMLALSSTLQPARVPVYTCCTSLYSMCPLSNKRPIAHFQTDRETVETGI